MATAEDAEILTLCHEVASGPSSATRGPQSRSARRWGDRSRPPALHDDITGPQPRASTRLCPAVDLHLARLPQLLRVHAVLGEARELEELADPNRVLGDRDVEYRGAGHVAILPEPKAPDEVATIERGPLLRRQGTRGRKPHRRRPAQRTRHRRPATRPRAPIQGPAAARVRTHSPRSAALHRHMRYSADLNVK